MCQVLLVFEQLQHELAACLSSDFPVGSDDKMSAARLQHAVAVMMTTEMAVRTLP